MASRLCWGDGPWPWWVTKGAKSALGSKALTEVWVWGLEVGDGDARLRSKLLLDVSGWNDGSGQKQAVGHGQGVASKRNLFLSKTAKKY